MKYYIAVAGNIGVGKSSLTELPAERLGWEPFYEAVAENPYLSYFYADMRRWSFHSQAFFLSRRLGRHAPPLEPVRAGVGAVLRGWRGEPLPELFLRRRAAVELPLAGLLPVAPPAPPLRAAEPDRQ